MTVRNFGDESGECEHGTYVGGCGIDWICGWCEDGISAREVSEIYARRAIARDRETVRTIRGLARVLREHEKSEEYIAQAIADIFHVF